MQHVVCRGGLAQGDASLTPVQAPKTASLLVSRQWPWTCAVATSSTSWKRWMGRPPRQERMSSPARTATFTSTGWITSLKVVTRPRDVLMGHNPAIGEKAMTDAERQARYRVARAADAPVIRTRRPADHRSRARRWQDAVAQLSELQAGRAEFRCRVVKRETKSGGCWDGFRLRCGARIAESDLAIPHQGPFFAAEKRACSNCALRPTSPVSGATQVPPTMPARRWSRSSP